MTASPFPLQEKYFHEVVSFFTTKIETNWFVMFAVQIAKAKKYERFYKKQQGCLSPK